MKFILFIVLTTLALSSCLQENDVTVGTHKIEFPKSKEITDSISVYCWCFGDKDRSLTTQKSREIKLEPACTTPFNIASKDLIKREYKILSITKQQQIARLTELLLLKGKQTSAGFAPDVRLVMIFHGRSDTVSYYNDSLFS